MTHRINEQPHSAPYRDGTVTDIDAPIEATPPAAAGGSRHRVRTAWRLAVATVRDSLRDRVPGLAAEVSFYLLLSLPPLLLVGLGALGYVGDLFGADAVTTIKDQILDTASSVLTADTVDDVVRPAVDSLLAEGRADILSIGAVLALWSGSRALKVITEAITIAYDLKDKRTWWQHRLLGLALTIAMVLMLAVLLPLLVIGPEFGGALADEYGLGRAFDLIWAILYFPVVIALGLSLLTWVYHIVPPHSTRWRRDIPGAILAFLVWFGGSFGLRIYATNFVESDSAYSYFGTPLVLLLWIYLTAAALLIGAELNAEIEKFHPDPANGKIDH